MTPNPYAPPGSLGPTALQDSRPSAYIPLGWRTTATRVVVVIATVFGIAMETTVISDRARMLSLAARVFVGGVTTLGFFGAVFVAAILHGVWVARVARNLRALGRTGMRFPWFLAVASLYIPVVNLALPIWVMTELWRASEPGPQANDRRWKTASSPRWLVASWWGAWNIAAASVWTSLGPYKYGEFPVAGLVGCVFLVISCVAGTRVLSGIDARQRRAADVLLIQTDFARPGPWR